MNEDDDDDDDDVGYGDDDGEEDDKNSHSRHTHSSFLNFTQPSALAAHTRPKKHSLKPSQNTLQNPFLPTHKTPSKHPTKLPKKPTTLILLQCWSQRARSLMSHSRTEPLEVL